MTCFLNPLPSLDTVLRRSLHRGKKERETVYVSVVEAAGGRLAEFSANDPRRLANLFSRGLEFTQTARVVTPTAATERESEQEVPWHSAPSRDRSSLGPRPAICFFFFFPPRSFSVFTPAASASVVSGLSPRRVANRSQVAFERISMNYGHDASLLV